MFALEVVQVGARRFEGVVEPRFDANVDAGLHLGQLGAGGAEFAVDAFEDRAGVGGKLLGGVGVACFDGAGRGRESGVALFQVAFQRGQAIVERVVRLVFQGQGPFTLAVVQVAFEQRQAFVVTAVLAFELAAHFAQAVALALGVGALALAALDFGVCAVGGVAGGVDVFVGRGAPRVVGLQAPRARLQFVERRVAERARALFAQQLELVADAAGACVCGERGVEVFDSGVPAGALILGASADARVFAGTRVGSRGDRQIEHAVELEARACGARQFVLLVFGEFERAPIDAAGQRAQGADAHARCGLLRTDVGGEKVVVRFADARQRCVVE